MLNCRTVSHILALFSLTITTAVVSCSKTSAATSSMRSGPLAATDTSGAKGDGPSAVASPSQLAGPTPAPTASRLVLNAAASFGAGNCTTLTLGVETSAHAPIYLSASDTVSLATSSASGTFYSDNVCTFAASTATIFGGTASSALHYMDAVPGTATVTVADTSSQNLAASSATMTMTATSQLAFAGNALTQAAAACGGLTVVTENASGSAVTQTSAVTLALSSSSDTGAFYSDSACTAPVTAAAVASGTSDTGLFYYQDSSDGAPTLTAQEKPSQNWVQAIMNATIAN